MSEPNKEKKYIISLSSNDYIELIGYCLANVRDDLADCGLEENKRSVDRAINIIDKNLEIKK